MFGLRTAEDRDGLGKLRVDHPRQGRTAHPPGPAHRSKAHRSMPIGLWTGFSTDMSSKGGVPVPIVTVLQSPRDIQRKRALVAAITQAFVDAYEISPDQVQVFIQEVGHDNWAKGGKLATDR